MESSGTVSVMPPECATFRNRPMPPVDGFKGKMVAIVGRRREDQNFQIECVERKRRRDGALAFYCFQRLLG